MLVPPSVRTPTGTSPLRPRALRTRGAVRPRPWTRLRARLSPCPRVASRTPAPASPFSMMNCHRGLRPERRPWKLRTVEVAQAGRLGRQRLARRSSSVIPNPRAHTGRLNRLADSRGFRLPRRPVVLPLPPCLFALRRDLLRGNPSALFRATEPGTIPVPHRRRSSGVASGRGFLPTVLWYPEPRLSVARRRRSCSGHHAVAPRTQLQRLVRRGRQDPAARLPGGSQT